MPQFGIQNSLSESTTQLNNQTHTHRNTIPIAKDANYGDLTFNLMSKLSKNNKTSITATSGLGRDYWLDDSSAIKCRSCELKFTTFRRKHHCRICGKIFCGNCTTFIDGSKFGVFGNKMRTCLTCSSLAERYEEYPSSEEDDSMIDDGPVQRLSYTNSNINTSPNKRTSFDSRTSNNNNNTTNNNGTPLLDAANPTESGSNTGNPSTPIYGYGTAPTPPPMMAIATTRKGEAVEIDIPRVIGQNNSTGTGRGESLAMSTRKSRTGTMFNSSSNRPLANLSTTIDQTLNSGYGNYYNTSVASGSNVPSVSISMDAGSGSGGSGNGTNSNVTSGLKKFPALSFTQAVGNAASSIFNFGNGSSSGIGSGSDVMSNNNQTLSATSLHRAKSSSTTNTRRSNGTTTLDEEADDDDLDYNSDNKVPGHASPLYGKTFHGLTPTTTKDSFRRRNNSITTPGANTLLSSTSSGDEEDSDDEQTMLQFMNNHQFNWPYRQQQQQQQLSSNISNKSFIKPEDIQPPGIMMTNRNIIRPSRQSNNRRISNYHRPKRKGTSGRIASEYTGGSATTSFGGPASGTVGGSGAASSANSNLFNRNVSSTINYFGGGFGNNDFEFLDDFLRAGENHAKQLITEILTDRKINNLNEWIPVLIKCLKKISNVTIELSNNEGFDLSTYLKIKKIPGSSIQDTKLIDGLVFSKILPLKRMPLKISNPRIMLITFQIEYDQSDQHKFSSLEPVIAQQDEFLKKLVTRIVTLKPNIVLTTSSVNGYALKLLADQNIAVATGIKFQVIEKLAKLTKADIITSMDKLAIRPNLGRCGEFKQRTFIYENIKRTYFYFTGCNPELGFTVVLRGANKEVLDKIKDCANLMAYVYLNVKLESGLMRDQCLQASEFKPTELSYPLGDIQVNSYKEAYGVFKNRILSTSAWVNFNLPYILVKLQSCHNLVDKSDTMYTEFDEFFSTYLTLEKPVSEEIFKKLAIFMDFFNVKSIDKLPFGEGDIRKIVKANYEFKLEFLKSEIVTLSRQWEQFWQIRRQSYLDPSYHQNMVTLFSMVSTKNATPCVGPDIQMIDFYWENDLCLGQFIEHICLHADDVCTEGCQLTLKEHFRTYVHGNGKVDVVLESNPHMIQGKENIIMAWSYCRICHNSTPILPLSDNAWKYSFGKYLELSFWCRGMKVKGATCEHDFYRDQIHYFSFQHLAVRVEYTDIGTLQLVPPRFQLFWQPEYDIQIKIETYQSVLQKSGAFFDSVRERLNRVKVDSMTIDKMEAGQKRIEELKERVEKEYQDIKDLVDHLYLGTAVTDHLKLNVVIREVQELSTVWNSEFDDFDKRFLPTEKEIKKITAFQLDRLFGSGVKESKDEEGEVSDDEGNHDEKNGVPLPEDETEVQADDERDDKEEEEEDLPKEKVDQQKVKPLDRNEEAENTQIDEDGRHTPEIPGTPIKLNKNQPRLVLPDNVFEDSTPNSSSGEQYPKLMPSPNAARRQGSLVLEKINELASSSEVHSPVLVTKPRQGLGRAKSESYSDKRLLWEMGNKEFQNHILRSNDDVLARLDLKRDEQSTGSKVKKLTEFFDAQEFFREREEEKQKLEKANKYMPMPKVNIARPRVEIYKDVSDVFRDPLERRELSVSRSIQDTFPKKSVENSSPDTSVEQGDDHSHVPQPLVRAKFGSSVKQVISKIDEEEEIETDDEASESVDESSEIPDSKDDEASENDLKKPASDKQQLQVQKPKRQQQLQKRQSTLVAPPSQDNQPEKVSILKSLRHFWADRSASLWEPLAYPLSSSEHIFVDSDVIVREDEPSSIIAFCLSTSDYSSKLSQASNSYAAANTNAAAAAAAAAADVAGRDDSSASAEPRADSAVGSIEPELSLEDIMLKKGFHLKYQFEEGYSIISCKIFFAEQFDAFRRQCGVTENFIQSLSRCIKWDSTGGKSGSAFLKTLDNRFIMKELSRTELEAFVQFAPSYFEYFAQALFHGLPTVLGKIFGFYQIQVKNSIPGSKSYTLDVLIMENLFYHRKMTRIFDLKGSMRNRHVEQTGKENEVLLDENMVEYIYESPLFVRENNKRLLRASLWNDTLFLAKMNVMDYSLVIGIDSEKKELVVGIIDFIRTFTWDKKLESWVKEKGLVGGTGVGKEPTVITPKQYKNRFREAMERYILMAPGPYYQGT